MSSRHRLLSLLVENHPGVLNKVYEKDGRQFGELTFALELPLKAMGTGAEPS